MTKTLYVGNLARTTDEDKLRDVFGQDGRTICTVTFVSNQKGRARNFAFVELSNSTEAEDAQKALDGAEIDGRAIRVRDARESRPGDGGFLASFGKGKKRDEDDRGGGSWGRGRGRDRDRDRY